MTAQVLVALATAMFAAGDSRADVPDQLASPSGDALGYQSVVAPPGDLFGPPQGAGSDGRASPGSPPLGPAAGSYVTGNYGVQAPPNQPIRVIYLLTDLLPNNQSSSDGRGAGISNTGQVVDHAESQAVPSYVRQLGGSGGGGPVRAGPDASDVDLKASGSAHGFSAGDFAPPEPQHISVFDDEGNVGGGGGGEGRFIDDEEDQVEPEVIELRVPVAQLVPVAVPYKVAVPVPHPYPVPVQVAERYEVPVEQVVEEVVERKVPVIVETLVPYPVVKHLPVEVEKIVAVPRPYPHPVPVHVVKYIHHFEKKHHKKGGKGR